MYYVKQCTLIWYENKDIEEDTGAFWSKLKMQDQPKYIVYNCTYQQCAANIIITTINN